MNASRYPVRRKLLAFLFLVSFVLLFPVLAWRAIVWLGVGQERINPEVAHALAVLRERVSVGTGRAAMEAAIAEQRWHTWVLSRVEAEEHLAQRWQYFPDGDPRPVAVQFNVAVAAFPSSELVYRSRFPCDFRVSLFFLLSEDERVAAVIEAQRPTCL